MIHPAYILALSIFGLTVIVILGLLFLSDEAFFDLLALLLIVLTLVWMWAIGTGIIDLTHQWTD